MKKPNLVVALLLVGFAAIILEQSGHLPFGRLQVPQTGFFPTTLAALLLGFSLILLAQALRGTAERQRIPDPIAPEGWVRIGATLATMVGFALVLERLGFLLTTFVLMVLLLRATESQKWHKVIAIAVATALFSYAVFAWLLGIPLPAGVLGT